MNKVVIDEKEYPYNPSKPFSGTLINKLEQVEKTSGCKRFSIQGPTTNAFAVLKASANIYAITNVQKLGYAGLSHIYDHKSRLTNI